MSNQNSKPLRRLIHEVLIEEGKQADEEVIEAILERLLHVLGIDYISLTNSVHSFFFIFLTNQMSKPAERPNHQLRTLIHEVLIEEGKQADEEVIEAILERLLHVLGIDTINIEYSSAEEEEEEESRDK